MKKSFWKRLKMIDIVVMVVVFFVFIAIIYKKYNYFACSSMKSEAKFALQQIYSAQMLYFNEFGKFLTIKDLEEQKRISLSKIYYDFVDEKKEEIYGFKALAIGKENTLVQGDTWQIDEKKALLNIKNMCKEK